jgi:glycosyltransferase involved in cell wall biosynthesis
MRIAHYIHDLDGQGGIETYLERLGHGLTAAGHEVLYVGLRGRPRPDRVLVHDEQTLYEEIRRREVDVLHLHKAVFSAPPADLNVVRTVHDNGAACPSGSRYLPRQQSPCPRTAGLATCLFGHYVDGCGSRRPAEVRHHFRRLAANRRVLPGLPTITVSQYLMDEMLALGYPANHLRVIRSPAPDGPATPPPLQLDGPPRLLFLGRLVPEKGVDWLLRALAHLPSSVCLDVAGEGHARPALETQARALGLGDRVTFHGWVAPAAVPSLLETARAVVVPSVWHEPAGLVSLEAAAYGRAAVVSTVGGIPEYATPDYALHVTPQDEHGLAEALTRLCTDPTLATTLGRAGHALAQSTFHRSHFFHQHEQLYAALAPDVQPTTASPVR